MSLEASLALARGRDWILASRDRLKALTRCPATLRKKKFQYLDLQFRSECPALPFLMAADRAMRQKVFRLLSEQRATYTSFSPALVEVLTNHKYL